MGTCLGKRLGPFGMVDRVGIVLGFQRDVNHNPGDKRKHHAKRRVVQYRAQQEKLVSFAELTKALQNNWEGYEELRQYAMNKITYYGNDDDEADSYVVRILDTFADLVLNHVNECPVKFIPGVSTFGRQIDWMHSRVPSPMGTKRDTILSGNDSPTPGTDTEGATAVIKSYCKANLRKQVCGAALDIKLHPSAVSGENGIAAHDLHDRAALMRLHGIVQLIDALDGCVRCGIKTDGVIGAANIIVDGSRNAHHIDTMLGQSLRTPEGAVTADGHNAIQAQELAGGRSLLLTFL